MIRWLRRYRTIIWVSVTLAMLLTMVGYGGLYLTSKDFSDSVAVVGKDKIPYIYYRRLVDREIEYIRKNHKDVTDDLTKEVKLEVLQNLIATHICALEARTMGLEVSDEELASAIQQTPEFQSNGVFNQSLYIQTVLQGFNMTVEDYELDLRRQLSAAKYQRLVFGTVKLVPDEIVDEYKRSHDGSDKNFKKDQGKFTQSLQRIRSLAALQSALRHAANHLDVRSFLEEREQGAGDRG